MSTMRNSVMLIGRATKPVMNSKENQANFKLVVTEERKVDDCYITNIFRFDCVANGKVAQRVVQKVEAGMKLAIDGSLRSYDYQDKVGDTHTHTEIVVYDLFLIDKPKDV